MAIEHVARLLTVNLTSPTRRHKNVVRLLEAFRGGAAVPKEKLVKESHLSEHMVEYYITRLKQMYMLNTHKDRANRITYSLNPEALHARVDTLFVDPVRNLARG